MAGVGFTVGADDGSVGDVAATASVHSRLLRIVDDGHRLVARLQSAAWNHVISPQLRSLSITVPLSMGDQFCL